MEEFEQHILTISEVFVYKVPPLKSASGHRAEDWNLANPLFTGCLKIFQINMKLKIVLYNYKDPTTNSQADDSIVKFGECPIEVKPKEDVISFVDAVIDSSRYYVVKLKDPASTKTVNIGIGFRERETAFDFKSALNEYVRYVDRMALAEQMAHQVAEAEVNGDETDTAALTKPLKDMSLKEGQKLHITVSSVRRKEKYISNEQDLLTGSSDATQPKLSRPIAAAPFLPPPPPPGSVVLGPNAATADPAKQLLQLQIHSSGGSTQAPSSTGGVDDEEDWDDFTGPAVAAQNTTDLGVICSESMVTGGGGMANSEAIATSRGAVISSFEISFPVIDGEYSKDINTTTTEEKESAESRVDSPADGDETVKLEEERWAKFESSAL